MGIFGWSYPPGCSGPPDDYEGPCDVCGKDIDDCICPECSECGTFGDPKCYKDHGMVLSQEQLESFKAAEQQWAEDNRRNAEYEAKFALEDQKYWDEVDKYI